MVSSSFLWPSLLWEQQPFQLQPSPFSSGAARPAEKQVISEYFDMLGHKVQAGRKMSQAPVCNLKNAAQPVPSPTPLPGPSTGSGGFAKSDAIPAPAGASIGQNDQGFGAVPWLKLTARNGATGGLQEVYRVNTAGGNPPATCADRLGSNFNVQYAAEYWFYEA
ncbi:hypothetical protein DID88_009893 [Monilinia fructigena]|uniref:Uncharacterized protein n=1 Tax=Monilinia fructigena TaxID=38457 RepID=A0A395IMK6_9HELO|nr:hypothetical protein DID88_009893 [Monilinia fructigena]